MYLNYIHLQILFQVYQIYLQNYNNSRTQTYLITQSTNSKGQVRFKRNFEIQKNQVQQQKIKMWLYILQLILLGLLSMLLILYYSHKSTAYYARLLVFLTFFICFVSFMILPIDIYENSAANKMNEQQQENQEHLSSIGQLWNIIFYVNFFACWIVLPFFQEYQDSGQFTFKGKVKDAFKMNLILIGVLCIGASAVVVYLVMFEKFSFSQIPSVFAMLVNVFGMLLVTLCLGFGLVSLPKQFNSKRDCKKRVNICHRMAQKLKNQEEEILEQIYHIKDLLTTQDIVFNSPAHVSYLLCQIEGNFNLQDFRAFDDMPRSLQKKSLLDLHKIIKRHHLHFQSCESQLDELIDELREVTVCFSRNNYRYKRMWYTFLFILSTIVSLIFYTAEISIFTTKKISVIYWLNYDLSIAYFVNCLLMIYIVYVVTHTIFRVKIYRIFQLHKRHSTAASLLFTSLNMSRISYPLCYNYLQLTSIPSTQFQLFLGQINIPDSILYIFPILIIIFAVFNLFDIYDTIMGYLGLGSYAFDEEEATEKSQEGRNILIQRLKQKNYDNMQLEMIQLL